MCFLLPDAGYHRQKDFPETLELKDVISAIKDAKELGLKRITITGGEPFLRPDLTFGIIDYALAHNINTSVESNFLLLDERIFLKIVNIRKRYDNNAMLLLAPTVLSLRRKVFNKLMGVPAYDFVFRRLKKYVKMSRNVKNLIIGAVITVLKDNIDEVFDLGDYLLGEVQVHSIKFNPVVELGRFRKEAPGSGYLRTI